MVSGAGACRKGVSAKVALILGLPWLDVKACLPRGDHVASEGTCAAISMYQAATWQKGRGTGAGTQDSTYSCKRKADHTV